MDKEKGLIKIDSIKSIMRFLQQPSLKIAEALTGILASDPNDLKLSAGRLVQACIKSKFLHQLGKELKEYRKKGKIKEDYFATSSNRASLYELLKFIDEEVPDEERFKAMKSIFLTSISIDTSKEDEILAYEIMQICKKLDSADILVLKAVYDIAKGGGSKLNGANLATKHASEWLNIVAHKIGHKIPSLVEISEEKLINLKLISGRMYADKSGVDTSPHFRLTQLGFKLCEFITKYE